MGLAMQTEPSKVPTMTCGATTPNGFYVCTDPAGHKSGVHRTRVPDASCKSGFLTTCSWTDAPRDPFIARHMAAADAHIAAVRAGTREPIIPRAA
jgi:hypothetical protein